MTQLTHQNESLAQILEEGMVVGIIYTLESQGVKELGKEVRKILEYLKWSEENIVWWLMFYELVKE